MRLPQFEHFAPTSVAKACELLAAHGAAALPLAGGTDLLVKMKNRKIVPRYVVNLKGISGLNEIAYDSAEGLTVGALVTIQALKNSVAVKRNCKILAQAAAAESSVQVRNMATIGGNICNASPAADAPLALIAAAARIEIAGVDARREISLERFYRGPGQSILQLGEIVTNIRVPALPAHTGIAYLKHAIRQTDIAIIGVAVMLTLDKGTCSAVKIALGSVAPTIIRARQAEDALLGQNPTADRLAQAAGLAGEESAPVNDIRQSADYRKDAIIAATTTALARALDDAKAGGF